MAFLPRCRLPASSFWTPLFKENPFSTSVCPRVFCWQCTSRVRRSRWLLAVAESDPISVTVFLGSLSNLRTLTKCLKYIRCPVSVLTLSVCFPGWIWARGLDFNIKRLTWFVLRSWEFQSWCHRNGNFYRFGPCCQKLNAGHNFSLLPRFTSNLFQMSHG